MSLGNVEPRIYQLQSLVGLNAATAGGFAGASARQNQGVAMFPDLLKYFATRADLSNSLNLKLALPLANNASAINVVSSAACYLLGVIVDNAEASATAFVQIWNAATATIGTTAERMDLGVLAGTMGCFLFPDVPYFGTALSWDTSTAAHGATRSTTGVVTVLVVYAS